MVTVIVTRQPGHCGDPPHHSAEAAHTFLDNGTTVAVSTSTVSSGRNTAHVILSGPVSVGCPASPATVHTSITDMPPGIYIAHTQNISGGPDTYWKYFPEHPSSDKTADTVVLGSAGVTAATQS